MHYTQHVVRFKLPINALQFVFDNTEFFINCGGLFEGEKTMRCDANGVCEALTGEL